MPLTPVDRSTEPKLYALRRLSPFLGVTQLVECGPARAASSDGLHWQLQVTVQAPRTRWSSLDPPGRRQRILAYGVWSKADGLVRLPLDPTIDVAATHSAAAPLLRHLPEAQQRVPFPLADPFELWLLDAAGQPLALLASRCEATRLPSPRLPSWRATARGDLSFRVPDSVEGSGASASRDRDRVEALLADAAGQPPRAQWFRRSPHVETPSAHRPSQDTGRDPDPEDFPELPVRSAWSDPDQQRLMDAVIDWQAPLLLMLPSLRDATRDRLERAACRRPLAVDAWHRLYPRIVNGAPIKTALVEATLRKSEGEQQTRP